MIVKSTWNGGHRFDGYVGDYSPVGMEWGENRKSASPMELLLVSLAGCTGMDVVDILQKMREKITKVEVSVDGERRREHPKIWSSVSVTYDIYGRNLSSDKSEKAVKLSVEKYCSVAAMFRPEISLKHSFKLHETEQ